MEQHREMGLHLRRELFSTCDTLTVNVEAVAGQANTVIESRFLQLDAIVA